MTERGRGAGTGSRKQRKLLKSIYGVLLQRTNRYLAELTLLVLLTNFDSEALKTEQVFVLFYLFIYLGLVSMLTDLPAFSTSGKIMKTMTFSKYIGFDLP